MKSKSYICGPCLSGTNLLTRALNFPLLKNTAQSGKLIEHTKKYRTDSNGLPKAINARFINTGATAYESGAYFFQHPVLAEVTPDNRYNIYSVFPYPIAEMQYSGIASGLTTTGLLINATDTDWRHYYGTDRIPTGCTCSTCLKKINLS